jgi:hypothetical protein
MCPGVLVLGSVLVLLFIALLTIFYQLRKIIDNLYIFGGGSSKEAWDWVGFQCWKPKPKKIVYVNSHVLRR